MMSAPGRPRAGRLALVAAVLALALVAAPAVAQDGEFDSDSPQNAAPAPAKQDTTKCGYPGGPCCCKVSALGRNDCCTARDHSCFKFDLGPGPEVGICMPTDAPKGCGQEGGPCCIASRANRFEITCGGGLTCIPPKEFYYRSTAQHAKLTADFAKAYRDPSVVGTCQKVAVCNKEFNPCGNKECPGVKLACPSGFYCANYADATVGDRCMPLPADAGKTGGRCLPNNSPDAPITDFPGAGKRAPPFCSGKDDICFTHTGPPTLRHRSFQNIFEPDTAKSGAARIWGTRCIKVPSPCGGVGEACCPGAPPTVVTDKPLRSYGTKWQGKPCDDTKTDEGAFCDGQWTALGGPLSGKCVANTKGCNDIGNKCCIRTNADKSERYCRGGGKRVYCVFTDNTCRQCPAVADTMLDFFVCT